MLYRKWIISIPVVILFTFLLTGIPSLKKDTSSDAFIDPNNPSVIANKRVEEVFGLSDPLVIAVVNKGKTGIYTPQSLKLVDWVTNMLLEQENIDPDKITSLSTESNIAGNSTGMAVEEFIDTIPISEEKKFPGLKMQLTTLSFIGGC